MSIRRVILGALAASSIAASAHGAAVRDLPRTFQTAVPVAVVDVVTGRAVIVGNEAPRSFHFLAWVPGSHRLTYSIASGPRRGVWTSSATDGSRQRLSGAPADAGAWSVDGKWLALSRRGHLVFVGANGSPTIRTGSAVAESAVGPWAPDGRSLMIGQSLASFPLGLLTGPLTTGYGDPIWAPDSSRVAFGGSSLAVISVAVPAMTVIDGPDTDVVGWPTTDALVAAGSDDTSTKLTKWDLATAGKSAVGSIRSSRSPARWWTSADATRIEAAAEGEDDLVRLWVLPGGTSRVVGRCLGPAGLDTAAFSTDGTKVVLSCHDAGE